MPTGSVACALGSGVTATAQQAQALWCFTAQGLLNLLQSHAPFCSRKIVPSNDVSCSGHSLSYTTAGAKCDVVTALYVFEHVAHQPGLDNV